MGYEDPRFPNRKHKDWDQTALDGKLVDVTPPPADLEKSEAEPLPVSSYHVLESEFQAPALEPEEAEAPIPVAAAAVVPPPNAPAVAEAPSWPVLREAALERIRQLQKNPTKFYAYIGIGAGVLFAILLAVIVGIFGGSEGRFDLGTVASSATGLTGHLYIEWDRKLNYRLSLAPSDFDQLAGFALAVSSPPRPLSVDLHLQNSEGFVLCSQQILLRFDARKAAALAAALPGADPSASAIDFARLDAEEAARLNGKDLFRNQSGADGQIASIEAQGVIPCSKGAYEKATAWSFVTNFPSIAEQNGLLNLQQKLQAPAPPPPLAKAPAARKKIAPAKPLPYTVEGDDTIIDFDPTQGWILTRGRKTFYLDKAAAAAVNPAWQDFPVSIHYKCDQSSACTLTHAGLGGLRVRMRR